MQYLAAAKLSAGPYDQAAPTALRQLELEFAPADVSCEEKHIEPVDDVVQAHKKRAFREANAELLRKTQGAGG